MSYTYRIQYRKENSLKFSSHLDFISLFSKTVRRAQLAVTLTRGYNTRYKFSFGPALSLGISGWQEYLDLYLEEEMDPGQIKEKMNQVSPPGLLITEVQKIAGSNESLNKLIRFAIYLVLFEFQEGNDKQNRDWKSWVNVQINQFLSQSSIRVTKKTKKGFKEVDLKPYIVSMEYLTKKDGRLITRLILDIRTLGSINPEIIIHAFLGQLEEKDIQLKEIIREKIILDLKEKLKKIESIH